MKRLAITVLLVSGLLPIAALAQNTPPVLDPIGPQAVNEGSVLNVRVTASDADIGDVITLTAEQLPPNALFNDSTSGVGGFTFQPDYSQSGGYQVVFIATDTSNSADTEFVDITVNDVDRPPAIAPVPPQSVPEGGHLGVRVTATDPDGNLIVLTADQLPLHASFADSSGGVGGLIFDPDFNQAGNYQVRVFATANALADTELVNITVTGTDRPPVIAPVPPQSVPEGGHLGVRITAIDPDGNTITLTADQLPLHASFADSSGGVGGLIFDPDFNQAGNYQVRVFATANALADTELVNITVTGTDRPPVIAPVPPQSVPEGGHLGVRITATDPDGDAITLTSGILPAHASFTDLGGGTGQFNFDPDLTQEGHYDIPFYASSNSPALKDTLIMSVDVLHINAPPVLNPIGPKSVNENQTLSFIVTSSDIDGQIPSLTALNLPPNAVFTDSLNGHGRFVFTPTYFQAGTYNVLFVASDGVLADSENVTITVNNVNRPPVLSPIGNRSVIEGNTISFRVTSSDADLQIPSLRAENLPANATFIDSTNGSGLFTFSPGYWQAGPYDIRFIASDGDLADTELVRITVLEAGNQAPVVDSIGPQSVVEGQNLTLLVSASDPDSTIPALQAFNLPANSAFADSGNGHASFTFNPNFNQAGVYNVLFRAFDGSRYDSLWVQITVIDVGFPPVLNPIGPRVVNEGAILQFVVTSSDPDGTFPHLSAAPLPTHATFVDSLNGHGLFTFSPDFTQGGVYLVMFIASDGALADSENVQITVNDVGNMPPILAPIGPRSVNEGDSLFFNISASDPDGTFPSLSAIGLPPNANFTDNLNGSGHFEFRPNFFQAGVYPVLFIASDGALADSESVQITVFNVNQPPVLGAIGPQTVQEGGTLHVVIMSYDPDGTVPSLSASPLPANASFVDSLNGDGLFTFQPDYSQSGVYNILFSATDGILADSEMVQVTVTSSNQPPVFVPLGSQFVFEGSTLSFTVQASDADGQVPSLTATNLLVHSTFVDNGNGTGRFDYSPDYTQAGVDTVTFYASDGSLQDTLQVEITTVDAGNQWPVLAPIGPRFVNEGQSLQFNVFGSDADGFPPILGALNLPANAAFFDSSNGVGTFTFNPDFTQAGMDTVLFFATDGQFADSEYVVITISNVNRQPVLQPISSQTITEGDSLAITAVASDPDGTPVTLSASPLAPHMVFIDHGGGSGSFGFKPDFTQSGVYNVDFIVSDGSLADTVAVQITVLDAGNQPPVLAAIDTAYFVTEGGFLQIPVSASDADGNVLTLTAAPLVTNMTFVDNGDGTGLFSFSPSFLQGGSYPVTFRVSDGTVFDSASTRIYVAEQGNQYPILSPIGPRTVAEGATLTIDVSATDPEGFIPFLFVDNPPDSSTFVDNHNGTGQFNYYPDYYSAGVDTVRFLAMDNGGLSDYEDVAITITDVNRTPRIVYSGDTLVVEGGTLTGTVTVYDSTDYQPGILSLTHGYLPPNATFTITGNGVGTFTFMPGYNQAGVDSAFFVAVDSDIPPLSDSRWFRFTVLNSNRRPVLLQPPPSELDQGDTLVLDITASDPDGDPVTLFVSGGTLPRNATFTDMGSGHGLFVFHPDYTQSGIFVVRFGASDGVLIDYKSALIQVHDLGNQRPTLNPIGSFTMTEGDSLKVHVTSSDPDSTHSVLTASGLVANMVFTDSTNGAGSLIFRPQFYQAGVYNVLVVASDGQYADSEMVGITVLEAGNQAPILANISNQSVTEGTTLRLRITATDPDSTIPILAAHNIPVNSSFADSSNGRGGFIFSPDFSQAGIYHVMFVAYDRENPALADSQDVAITVNDYNRWPIIDPLGPYTINEGQNLNFTVVSHDPDSTFPILYVAHIPPNSTFNDNGNGTGFFNFTPSYFQAGVDSARFVAADRIDPNLFVTMTVRITILDFNRPPILVPIPDTSIGDGFLLVINIQASDPDSVFPIMFQHNRPDSATFVDNDNGTAVFRWRPRFVDIGTYNVIFGCRDRNFLDVADSDNVVIEVVTAGNHPPMFTPVPDQHLVLGDTLDLAVTATDVDGDPLVISHVGTLPYGLVFSDLGGGHATIFWVPAENQEGDTLVTLVARDTGGLTDSLRINISVISFIRGDANGNGVLNGVDVVYLVNYLKGVGPPPDPYLAGDANGNGEVNGLDVVYLVNYFKGGGPPPPPVPGGPQRLGQKRVEASSPSGM